MASVLDHDADDVRWLYRQYRLAGSPGVNELKWLAPFRPGDDLTLDVDVVEARLSRSRPETGIGTFKGIVRNAAGQALWSMTSPIIVKRREAAVAG